MQWLIRQWPRAAFYGASALVALLSLTPGSALPAVSISDKVGHALAYALLALLGGLSSRRNVLRTIIGLAVFGVFIELLQTFSPGRWPDPADAAANVVGVLLGGGAAALLRGARTARGAAGPSS